MARARRSTSAGTAAANGSGAAFVCPECGREFTRAASLGAHRNRAHGVAGTNTRSARRRRRSAGTMPKAAAAGMTRTARAATRGGNEIDRDALLGALFPQGVPPRESVIREVAAWLDQAERLAKLR
jgi:predicted RNA-binding Zn-ribbon protein involved in translation (DUF1610 family)